MAKHRAIKLIFTEPFPEFNIAAAIIGGLIAGGLWPW